jgi:hypothetical protein
MRATFASVRGCDARIRRESGANVTRKIRVMQMLHASTPLYLDAFPQKLVMCREPAGVLSLMLILIT